MRLLLILLVLFFLDLAAVAVTVVDSSVDILIGMATAIAILVKIFLLYSDVFSSSFTDLQPRAADETYIYTHKSSNSIDVRFQWQCCNR
jgi:hypothetical protein